MKRFRSRECCTDCIRRLDLRGTIAALSSLPGKESGQLFAGESRLSQHRHQSSLGHIAIVLRDNSAAARDCIIENEVLPEVWSKPVALKKAENLPQLNGG